MRGFVLLITFAFALAPQAGAQTSVRGGSRPSHPGRVSSPQPPAKPSVSTVQPAKPDPRLGAGGIRPNTGNILYPGTPDDRSVGSILYPGGRPEALPIPSIVQPAPSQRPQNHDRGYHRGRRYSGAYPIYGVYPLIPNVIAVPGNAVTNSSSGYVVTVGEDNANPATEQAPASETNPDYWLIALRGGLIYAVSGYAIEERALRFVTLQGDEYVIPLPELDRDFTAKLNLDRGVRIDLD